MYKIYYNNKLFSISRTFKHIENPSESEIKILVNNFLDENQKNDIEIFNKHIEPIFDMFKSHFKIIEAAGGLVFNDKKELLVIERLGVPDLPKGKIETGEQIRAAALREVEEECGIKNIKITKELNPTFHIYFREKFILKKTYWFEMKYFGSEILIPQKEENITAVGFIPKVELPMFEEKTYRNLKDLFKYVIEHKSFL